MGRRRTGWAGLLLTVLGLMVPVDATAAPVETRAVPPMGDFPVGFWCGPPAQYVTVERFQQIRNAGFTVVFPACEGPFDAATNRRVLDAAQATGLKAIIRDARLPYSITGVPDATARIDAVIADYRSYPALAGYDLLDEPGAGAFAGLGEVAAYLRQHDPSHLTYINLLPNYGWCCWGVPGYDEYLRRFVDQVRPELLSYDHYPLFSNGSDRAEYFPNLETLRNLSLARSLPFWQIIQVTPHYSYRSPTEAEKLWQAMQTLAHGGKGVMSFTYWTPRQCSNPGCPPLEGFYDGIIDRNGNPTAQYAEITRVNHAVRAIGRHLLTARSRMVFRTGNLAPGPTPRPAGAPVYVPSDAPLTAGVFDSADHTYTMLANRDYRAATSSKVVLSFGASRPEWLDVATNTWRPVTASGVVGNTVVTNASLGAGAAILYRTRNPVPAGPVGPEVVFGRVRGDVGHTHGVDQTYGATWHGPQRGWNSCDAGYTNIGNSFHANGFWVCVRNDLVSRGFYVGNVVADHGHYYRVQHGRSLHLGYQGWNGCAAGSTFMGHFYNSNGFWICQDRPEGQGPEALVGVVRSDAATLYYVDGTAGVFSPGGSGWNHCPAGYTLDGVAFHSNGFWLCARNDLLTRPFYLGNVVNNAGYYYSVVHGSTSYLGLYGWNQCAGGSRYLGRIYSEQGFWLCMA